MDILTRGIRRFEIVGLNEEKTYLRGEVQFFDDDDLARRRPNCSRKLWRNIRGLLETGELSMAADPELHDPQLSFQLAQALQDLDFLSVLLRNRSEAERLKQLTDYLARQIPRLRETSRMRKLAPLNGHGAAPAGMSG